MADIVFNARNTTLRRVRLKPSLSSTALLYTSSNCYLNSTPINNFVLPPSPPPCVFSSPSLLNTAKSSDRALKPSLRKLDSESNATTAIIKSVHFNDPLTRVVHFYTPPPLDEYDEDDEEETEEDEEEEEEEEQEEEEESKLEDAFLELYMVQGGLQDECDSLAIAQSPTSHSLATNNKMNTSLSLPNWPLTIHPARRFISQMVSLESLVWNHTLQVVQGRVLVHNLAFEKKVAVRCSFDDWKTWTDVDAYYKGPAFQAGLSDVNHNAFDRFMFELHVPNVHAFSCDLAVRYQTLGQEFWDNNNGNNFSFQSMPPVVGSTTTLGEQSLSLFKAIMHDSNNNNNSNKKEGLSIISTLHVMECSRGSNHHHYPSQEEKIKQSCRHGARDDIIVSQQQLPTTPKTTMKSRHTLDRFKFSKYGASKIPAAPVPGGQRSTLMQQQQRQMLETQLVVVDLSEQHTGNCNDALIHNSSNDEAIDLKETLYI